MSIEKPQPNESIKEMKGFREKVRHLMQDEVEFGNTAHFSSVNNREEFLDSLNEEDLKWFNFAEDESRALRKDNIHNLSSEQVNEYKAKIEEFKQSRSNFVGLRSIWYEFLANKFNIVVLKLFILDAKRGGKSVDYPREPNI